MIEAQAIESSSPPDGTTLDRELHCPLCEYNLRGLVEPRCPECGHRFDWRQLLDIREHQHPYLFEHYPRRNVRSFLRTFRHSLLPRRFWLTLQPIHTPVVRRMLLYWAITASFVLACGVIMFAVPVYRYYTEQQFWQRMAPPNPPPSGPATVAGPSFWWVLRKVMVERGWYALRGSIFPVLAGCLLWPWLTFLSLLVYRASLRQARIRPVHVLRCVIYSADLAALAIVPLYFALSVWNDPYLLNRWQGQGGWYFPFGLAIDATTLELGILMLLLLGYRLAIAYRRYLHFPHAAAAVLASQVMVGLVLLKALFLWNGR
jgi:hypothetical protein